MPQHLFTFELDGKQLRSVADCVRQLQLLEEMGRVWGQNMLLEVQGPKFMLVDIETKVSDTEKPTEKPDDPLETPGELAQVGLN